MHSLQFGGGATQDLQSREADAHTHYFHIRNKASRPVTHVAGLFLYPAKHHHPDTQHLELTNKNYR